MTQYTFDATNKNRVAICYLVTDSITDAQVSSLNSSIKTAIRVLGTSVATASRMYKVGAVNEDTRYRITLKYGNKTRTLSFVNGNGELVVGVYFYNQPAANDDEPVSVSGSICTVCEDAFDDSFFGASAIVVPANANGYTVEVK